MKKKTLRTETKYFDQDNPFKAVDEKKLVKFLIELLYKSNNLLNLSGLNPINQDVKKSSKGLIMCEDQVQSIEFSLNKEDVMLDKSKVVIIRLHKLYMTIPFTVSKIEVRVRNILINVRPKLTGIASFTQFYLDSVEEAKKLNFDPAQDIIDAKKKEKENRGKPQPKAQAAPQKEASEV